MPNEVEETNKDRAAFERVAERLAGILADEVALPNVDVGTAVVGLMPVARRAAGESMRPRFASLPAAEFDIRNVDELETFLRAARHAQSLHATATATRPDVLRVPAELTAEANEVKGRMQRVTTYYFDDHPVYGAEVAAIRSGTGYLDLAQDLSRYARLYRQEAETVRSDRRHYREGDAALAESLADRLFDALGLGAGGRTESADTLGRTWTLLRRTYEEVAAAGRWLWRHEGGDELFPTIHVASRAHAPATRPKADADAAPREEPVAPVT
jgi:hypothetical protein